jgi:ABC-2 type transport system permease protein
MLSRRRAWVLFRTNWYKMMEYRAEAVIWMLAAFAQPLVTLAVWISVAGQGSVGGYTRVDFIHYFLAVMFVERMTRSWVTWELEYQVRMGVLSAYLVRPIDPIWHHVVENLVYKLFFAAILAPALVGVGLLWPSLRIPLEPALLPAFVLSVLLALQIRFLMCYILGSLAFWTTQSLSAFYLVDTVMYFLGGRIAPLSIMPPLVAELARWMPFRAMIAFPVEVMIGRADGAALIEGLLLQAAWLLVFIVLRRVLWQAGRKVYGAVGG